jgi:hypothetical protein
LASAVARIAAWLAAGRLVAHILKRSSEAPPNILLYEGESKSRHLAPASVIRAATSLEANCAGSGILLPNA